MPRVMVGIKPGDMRRATCLMGASLQPRSLFDQIKGEDGATGALFAADCLSSVVLAAMVTKSV